MKPLLPASCLVLALVIPVSVQERPAPPVVGEPLAFTPWYSLAISLKDAPKAGAHLVDVRYAHRELGQFMHRELIYQFRNRFALPVTAVYDIEYTPIPGDALTGGYDGPTYRERKRVQLEPGEMGPELSVRGVYKISSLTIVEAYSAKVKRADPADGYGYTELMKAARRGLFDRVRELLRDGSDPNRQASDGYTALMFAANGGFTDVVEELLKSGADPNLRNDGGYTALGIVDTVFPEVAGLLVRHGGIR